MSPIDEEKQFAIAYGCLCKPDQKRGYGWCKYERFGWLITKREDWLCTRKFEESNESFSFATLEDALEFVCQCQTGPVQGF